jgi:hypothetical protein
MLVPSYQLALGASGRQAVHRIRHIRIWQQWFSINRIGQHLAQAEEDQCMRQRIRVARSCYQQVHHHRLRLEVKYQVDMDY